MDSGNDDPSGNGMRIATTTGISLNWTIYLHLPVLTIIPRTSSINSSLPGASKAEPLKLDSGEGKATTGLQGT